jgi:hypothetical protein
VNRLFNRVTSVTIAKTVAGKFFETIDELTVEGLRVVFSIEKTLGKEPNTCTCSIFNFAKETRAELQKKPLTVRISAGYDGEAKQLFTGDLTYAESHRVGADYETKMTIGDGERAYRYARVNRSFRAGATTRDAMEAIVGSMGLKMPKSLDDAKEMISQLASGGSFHGPSQKELSRLLKQHGMGWSVQDGRLQVQRENDVRSDEAILVSQDTGLVGVPTFGPPKKKKSTPTLTFKMLLYPELTPGGKVLVQSADINGTFKVERVRHTGDTHGPEMTSEVEARPV